MRFAIGCRQMCMLLVGLCVLCSGNVAAWAQDGSEAQVLVYNDARIEGPVLDAAEAEADRIFRTAGVRLKWTTCSFRSSSENEACHSASGARQFVVRILPNARTSSDLVFGHAFLDEAGNGKYADVFYDRIRTAHDQYGVSVSQLTGAVMVHELGHMLLGFSAHSRTGIMMPIWEQECLRRLGMGEMLFTADQAKRIQVRLAGAVPKFASTIATSSDWTRGPISVGSVMNPAQPSCLVHCGANSARAAEAALLP